MMRSKRTRLVYMISALLILGLGYAVLKPKPQAPKQRAANKAIIVETSKVQISQIADQFDTLGSLNSSDSIDISSEVSGQIASILFKPGQKVKEGALLIQLDARIYQSELASAKANLKLSQMNFKRTNELAKRRLASEQALDQAKADLKEKENLVNVKQAQLDKFSLKAPFSGQLGSKTISVGQYVNVGQPLVHLIANQKLRVEYHVPERYLPLLKKGQKISILSEAFPQTPYTGEVDYISPAIDKDTRTVTVEAVIDNAKNRLYSGLFVRVTHRFDNEKKRILVPEESLIPTIKGQKIFVLRNDKAMAVNVVTGAHHADMTEVKKGLAETDIVIIRGQHKLKDGSHVIDSKQA